MVGDRATPTPGSIGTSDTTVRDEERAVATVARVWSSRTEATGSKAETAGNSETIRNGEAKAWAEGKEGFNLNFSISLKSNFLPHFIDISDFSPQPVNKLSVGPSNVNDSQLNPNTSEICPSIPCHNSFKALANSSTFEIGERDHNWIFDCGATDTMSFGSADF